MMKLTSCSIIEPTRSRTRVRRINFLLQISTTKKRRKGKGRGDRGREEERGGERRASSFFDALPWRFSRCRVKRLGRRDEPPGGKRNRGHSARVEHPAITCLQHGASLSSS
ncbi:hypothetical protein B296_00042429 [Ensete ventricosum]|uniref:Uncharacterized protein n=1 Tax=Ensete ventricosum TaxID=4639 RepID=A0A426ZCS7_ENSVE|nr:hypothetical protein B296_00042429 [Ensete ventricosum]